MFCSEDVGQSPGRGRESDLKEMTSQTKWWWLDPADCLCNSHQLCNSQQHQHQQHDLKDKVLVLSATTSSMQMPFQISLRRDWLHPTYSRKQRKALRNSAWSIQNWSSCFAEVVKRKNKHLPSNLSLTVPDPTTPSISAANCCSPKLPPNCPQIISNHWIVLESSEASKD